MTVRSLRLRDQRNQGNEVCAGTCNTHRLELRNHAARRHRCPVRLAERLVDEERMQVGSGTVNVNVLHNGSTKRFSCDSATLLSSMRCGASVQVLRAARLRVTPTHATTACTQRWLPCARVLQLGMQQPEGLGSTGCIKQSNAAATHKHPSSKTHTS